MIAEARARALIAALRARGWRFATATGDGVRTERRDFGAPGRAVVRLRSVETALELALQAVARRP